MPRHLTGDAHEWINEIPTVPTHSLAKLQPSQRSWDYLCMLCFSSKHLQSCNHFQFQQHSLSKDRNFLFLFFVVFVCLIFIFNACVCLQLRCTAHCCNIRTLNWIMIGHVTRFFFLVIIIFLLLHLFSSSLEGSFFCLYTMNKLKEWSKK